MDSQLSMKLERLAKTLLDPDAATVLVEPQHNASGFWFGGGNMIRLQDGTYILVGRYRNAGDSRQGLAAGERGLELAILQSDQPTGPFENVFSLAKQDVKSTEHEVLSIEGAALYQSESGLELFISSEKQIPYPDSLVDFQKPGTGIWSIDVRQANEVLGLANAPTRSVLSSADAPYLHIKDPVVFAAPNGNTAMIYCSHPFSWTSSNSGLALRESGVDSFYKVTDSLLPRGFVWDVACTRITDRLAVPPLGMLQRRGPVSLFFYDGAECVRQLDENPLGVQRPRGYSCEELGGLAYGYDENFPEDLDRLSVEEPFFVSPTGTGCSRYVSTLVTEDAIIATWQQSQADCSQPLVVRVLPMEEVEKLLA